MKHEEYVSNNNEIIMIAILGNYWIVLQIWKRDKRKQYFFVWGRLLFNSMLIELCKFKCQKWKREKN